MGNVRPSLILPISSLDDGTRERARTRPNPGRYKGRNGALPTCRKSSKTHVTRLGKGCHSPTIAGTAAHWRNLNCYRWNLPGVSMRLRDDDRSPTVLVPLPSVLDFA